MTTKKKTPAQPATATAKPVEQKKTQPKKAPPKQGIFKQPLQKPQPWSFGGRGARSQDEGAKAQPDAERLAGKSRKVH